MAQKTKMAAVLAAAACLLSACGMKPITTGDSSEPTKITHTDSASDSTETPHADTTAAEQTSAEITTETTAAPAAHNPGFPKGVYWGVGNTDDWYYEFDSDSEGSMVYQSMGARLSFEYERTGNRVCFYVGSRDNVKSATVSDERDGGFTLSFDGGDLQVLKKQDADTIDDLQFYSTAKLIEMLRTKYQAATGKTPDSVEKSINQDGMIEIRFLWEDDSREPYIATLDRFTAKGKDSNGKNLDLTPYA